MQRENPVRERVVAAIERGTPLEAGTISSLRARSEQVVSQCKAVFWVGVIVVNLLLWVPLPFAVSGSVLVAAVLIALAIAIVVPLVGLRRHQLCLELLKPAEQAPKKKTASPAGREYIDKVRKSDRPFINAEFELLEGSKWSGKEQQE